MHKYIIQVITHFLLLSIVCGCSGGDKPGVISLMDRVGEIDVAPWRVILCIDHGEELFKGSRGLRLEEPRTIVQTAAESMLQLTATVSTKGTMVVRIVYHQSKTLGHVEARLKKGNTLIAADRSEIQAPGVTLELTPLNPGSYGLELIHTVDPGAEVPITRIVAAQLEATADNEDRGELGMLLNWLGRAGYDSARKRPWRKHITYSAFGTTRDCLLLSTNDSLEIGLPEGSDSRSLRLWYSGLTTVPDGVPTIHVEQRIDRIWRPVHEWQVGVDRKWHVIDIDPEPTGRWGDAMRIVVSGSPSLIGISEPILLRPKAKNQKRNLLVIDLDTARADRFTCYGYTKRPTSTRLDSIMERKGFVIFNRAYAPATWTLSSTAKFLASRYLHTELQSQGGISEHTPMLAEILRRNGYYCSAFTAGGLLRTPGFDRGFHEYYWSMRSGRIEGSFPDAAKWLESGEEPFFLFLHTYEPHYPYTRTTFARGLPRGRLGDLTKGEKLLPADLFHYSVLSQEEQEYVSALYDGGMKISADAVADLFTLMDRLSLWESTVVIILSDHGEELFEHFGIFARHGHSLYNEVLRVPFMIYAPQNKGYRLVEDPVSLVDLVPTVADLLDVELSTKVDGTSLVPLLQGRSMKRPVPILANMAHPFQGEGICLIQNDLKYMEINHRNTPDTKQLLGDKWRPGRTNWTDLFRLSGDPEERNNLVNIAPSLAKTMQESLRAAVLRTLPPVTSTDIDEEANLRDDLAQQLILLGYLEE